MPNAYSVTFTTTGAKTPVVTDYQQSPFNASVAAIIASGTATYGIEYTLDDPDGAAVTWFSDANLPPGQTATGVSNYAFPVRAVRVNITAISGSLRFVFLQGTQQP